MPELQSFVASCVASGGVFATLCALVVIPPLAWIGIRLLAPSIQRLSDVPNWQAPLAATAAATPGALFATLAFAGFLGGAHSGCLQFFWGKILMGTIVALASGCTIRATTIAYRRTAHVRALYQGPYIANERLARIAASAEIEARIIFQEGRFLALAGIRRPIAIVSTETLAALDDDALRAALLHERGHARHGDQLIAFGLAFLADMLPLPSHGLIATYREARELSADRHATASTASEHLATAIIALARAPRTAVPVAALADSAVQRRLRELLTPLQTPARSRWRLVALAAAVALVYVGGLAPSVAAIAGALPCAMQMAMR